MLELPMELSSLQVGRVERPRSKGEGESRLRPGVLLLPPPSDRDRVFVMGEAGTVGQKERAEARSGRSWPASFASAITATSSQSMAGAAEDNAAPTASGRDASS